MLEMADPPQNQMFQTATLASVNRARSSNHKSTIQRVEPPDAAGANN
jgi:hypothetical protein